MEYYIGIKLLCHRYTYIQVYWAILNHFVKNYARYWFYQLLYILASG